jgi:uncharacterized membrane protein YeaQ/YmgE (transglycosylase-associated protein family)
VRKVGLVVIGLIGGFIIGIVAADIGYQLFGQVGAAVLNPFSLAIIGALVVLTVDTVQHRQR